MKFALKYFYFPAVLFASFSFFNVSEANAATLYFSPSSGNFSVGNILTASVFVNTQGEAINNTDAVINFPAGLLDVVSVSKSGSIFSLWVEEPAFSNSAGTISFNGGLPTPGYSGTAGKMLSIVFRVKKAGSASLIFSSAAVRANDGYGTDVLQSRGQAQFTLKAVEAVPVVPPAEVIPGLPILGVLPTADTPSAPKISSPTHSNPEEWYANNDPKFVWGLPKGLTGISIALSKLPTTNPGTRSDGLFAEYAYSDVEDGVSYFHIRVANSSGWSPITHYRVQIDTKPPVAFTATVAIGVSTTLQAKSTDALSGIAYYTVKADEADPTKVNTAQLEAGTYVLENVVTGKHSVQVIAFDKAGNSTSATADFTAASPQAPVFTDYPTELSDGDILILKGTTHPNALLSIWLQRDSKDINRFSLRAKEDGTFMFIGVDRVKRGLYQAWAEAVIEQGQRTEVSKPIFVNVKQALFWKLLADLQTYLTIFIPVLALLIILILLILHGMRKIIGLRRRIRHEVNDVENEIHKAFDILHDDLRAHLKLLNKVRTKRELTVEEEKIASRLKKDLDLAEKSLRKKVEVIEKEI